MKKMFIKPINFLIELDKPIIQVTFENNLEYRDFICSIKEQIIYSENDEPLDIEKKIHIITDIYNIDINDKKNITYLYKCIVSELDDEAKQEFIDVNNKLINILGRYNETSEYLIDYEDIVDINKVLNLYQVKYNMEKYNYFEMITKYIIILSKVLKINTFISFSLLRLLSNNEIDLLSKELIINKINLIDFDFNNEKKEVKFYEIDEDWCII